MRSDDLAQWGGVYGKKKSVCMNNICIRLKNNSLKQAIGKIPFLGCDEVSDSWSSVRVLLMGFIFFTGLDPPWKHDTRYNVRKVHLMYFIFKDFQETTFSTFKFFSRYDEDIDLCILHQIIYKHNKITETVPGAGIEERKLR